MKTHKVLILICLALMLTVAGTVYAQNSDDTYIIGNLNNFGYTAFAEELATLGYVEGENLTTMVLSIEPPELRFEDPEEYQRQYDAQVQAMVDAGVDLFVTNTDSDAIALQRLVGDVPIIFARSDDPVATGAVESLLNPGGSITGVVTNKPHERRVQIMAEILPDTDAIYYLYNPALGNAEKTMGEVNAVAAELGIEVYPAPVTDLETGLDLLANIPEDVDWLFLTPVILTSNSEWSEAMINTSLTLQIPGAYILGDPAQGWAISYGPTIADTDRQAAQIVDLILRGADPADIPVRNAENFLAVNLETAEAIGLNFPLGIMRQADFIARPGDFASPEEGADTDSE